MACETVRAKLGATNINAKAASRGEEWPADSTVLWARRIATALFELPLLADHARNMNFFVMLTGYDTCARRRCSTACISLLLDDQSRSLWRGLRTANPKAHL